MTNQNEPALQPTPPAAPAAKKKKKGGIFLLILFLFWWTQNYFLVTARETIQNNAVTEPMTIAVISDLHAGRLNISDRRIINRIKESAPDLICVLGDMYTDSENGSSQKMALEFMQSLAALDTPVYYVPGEHDRSVTFMEQLTQSGIHVMCYAQEDITVNGNPVTIYGIDNAYFSPTFDLTNEFASPDPSRYSILLAHIPQYEAYASFGADLTLCGDTHGGIIRLPFFGPLNYQGNWIPELLYPNETIMDKGLFPYSEGTMFITSGLGNYPSAPVRMFNNPEVAILEITP